MTINYNGLHAHLYITVDRSLYLSLSNGSSGDKRIKAAKYKVHMTTLGTRHNPNETG